MAKVTVVVPVYNIEGYIQKCMDSLVSQSFQDFQVYLVNDGSTDHSLDLLQKQAQLDSRFEVLDKTNGGLSDARNYGLARVQTEYVYFLDGDDFLEPTCLERCIQALDQTQADLVIFDIYQYFLQTNKKEIIANSYPEGEVYTLDAHPEMMTKILNAAWNKMARTSLYTANHLEYPFGCYYEDLGTTYRLLLKAKGITFVREPLYNYLADRPGNITQQFNWNVYHVLDMVKLNLDYFREQGVEEKYYEELEYLAGVNILECLKKTRDVQDEAMVSKYIQVCFWFLHKHFPSFPKCKYTILKQRHDWIYAHEKTLRFYLKVRKLWHH